MRLKEIIHQRKRESLEQNEPAVTHQEAAVESCGGASLTLFMPSPTQEFYALFDGCEDF